MWVGFDEVQLIVKTEKMRSNHPQKFQFPSPISSYLSRIFLHLCWEHSYVVYFFICTRIAFLSSSLVWHKQHPSKDRALPVNISTCCFFFPILCCPSSMPFYVAACTLNWLHSFFWHSTRSSNVFVSFFIYFWIAWLF